MPRRPHAARPSRPGHALSAWLPSSRALLWVLGAIAAGLLLFLLVWNRGRDDFYRAGPAAPTAAAPEYAPLPAPVAGERGDISDIAPAPTRERDAEAPRLVETPPPPTPGIPATPASAPVPAAAISARPEPISSPAPRYPRMALRRGERGTVMVSVEVGPDGVPGTVEVATSSGSRLLDRAAVDAVRRWRFRPAMAGERPVAARVQVPISFQPQ